MQEFIKYLEGKGFTKNTQNTYLRNVNSFLKWIEKEAIQTAQKDILDYLEHLKDKHQQQNKSRQIILSALKHYFAFLLQNGHIASNPAALIKIRGTEKKQLYRIFSYSELENLYDNFYHHLIRNFDERKIKPNLREYVLTGRERNFVMLGILIYQGICTNELQNIKISDLDLNKATIRINGTLNSNARTLPLKAPQIGALIKYTEIIRPKFFPKTEHLFFPLPTIGKKRESTENLMNSIKLLTQQTKSTDKNFVNFKQIRASVITHWLKTEGLRKTQYNAGHKNIGSTERYIANNLDQLTQDLEKFNPF